MPRWGAEYRDFFAKYYTRHAAMVAQTENLPYADQTIDLDPNVRDAWGLPAPRADLRLAAAERARARRVHAEEDGGDRARAWVRAGLARAGEPGRRAGRSSRGRHAHGRDPKTSVVNKYGQSWDMPNLFVIGSSTFPTMSGFNPTLTIQALAYMSADAIVNRYRKNPGALL